MADLDLEALTAGVHTMVPIMGAMELSVVEAERGRAAATIPPGPNANHFGAMYAGSLFTVAEMLGGVLGLTSFELEGFIPIVKSLEIRFLKPGRSTVTARASISEEEIARIQAEAEATGKSQFVLTTEVTDEDGVLVAATEGVYQMRKVI